MTGVSCQTRTVHRSIACLLVVVITAAACSTGERPTLGAAPAEELWREEVSLAGLTLTNRALADIGVVCVATEYADGGARLCLPADPDPEAVGVGHLFPELGGVDHRLGRYAAPVEAHPSPERSLWMATALAWVDPGTDVRLEDGTTATPVSPFALPDGRQAAFVIVEAGPWTLHFVHDGRQREFDLPVPDDRGRYPSSGPYPETGPTGPYPETSPGLDAPGTYPETSG